MPGFNIGGLGAVNSPDANVETSRRQRYIWEILEPLPPDLLVRAHKCGRPTIEFDRIVMHHGQDEIYMPGKNRWAPIEINFYQIHKGGGDYTAARIYQWWSESVLNIRESRLTNDFKRNCRLYLLEGQGGKVWEYHMLGTWPSKITPENLDYSDSAIAEIVLTLQIDKCREVPHFSRADALRSDCDPAPLIDFVTSRPTPPTITGPLGPSAGR